MHDCCLGKAAGLWELVRKGRYNIANHKIMAHCLPNPLTHLAPPPCHNYEHAKTVSFDLAATTTNKFSAPQQRSRTIKDKKQRSSRRTPGSQKMSPPIQPTRTRQPAVSPLNVTEDSDATMKWKVLNRKAKTGIADAGASASYGQPEMSDCGKFEVGGDLFNPTGRKSTKIFQYAGGSIAAADKINEFKFDVCDAAKEVHMVPGIQNTLVSTNQFAKANYAWIFDKDMVNIYEHGDFSLKKHGAERMGNAKGGTLENHT